MNVFWKIDIERCNRVIEDFKIFLYFMKNYFIFQRFIFMYVKGQLIRKDRIFFKIWNKSEYFIEMEKKS